MDEKILMGIRPENRIGNPDYRVLAIYIEPTPYILGLLGKLHEIPGIHADILFLQTDKTQSWGLTLDSNQFKVLPGSGFAALKEIVAKLSRRPDVVHLAGWANGKILLTLLSAMFLRIPVTIESDTQMSFEGNRLKEFAKHLVYPFLLRIPRVVFPGGTRQASFFRHFGVQDDKIVPANMTVDVEYISKSCETLGAVSRLEYRSRHGIPAEKTVFIFVGRLVKHKGVSTLVAAFRQLYESLPDICLLIVGDGPELQGLKGISEEVPSIKLMGRLNQEEVIQAMNASDIGVVPSLFEPWGLVVNEALAAGLPLIVSDRVGAADDLVIEGQNGLVFKAGDEAELRAAMFKMISSASLRAEYGKSGKQRIAPWTLGNSAKRYANGWFHLLSQSST